MWAIRVAAPARRVLAASLTSSPSWRTFTRASGPRLHGHDDPNADRVLIHWFDKKSSTVLEKSAAVGSTLLEAAHRSGIDLEGACEGSVACSTCHCILEHNIFESLEEPTEEEDDMLDQAFGLTETSRLGCQVEHRVLVNSGAVGSSICPGLPSFFFLFSLFLFSNAHCNLRWSFPKALKTPQSLFQRLLAIFM